MLNARMLLTFAAFACALAVGSACATDEDVGISPLVSPSVHPLPDTDETFPPVGTLNVEAPLAAGAQELYFVQSDHEASTTCLFFMNASNMPQTAILTGFDAAGVPSGTWSVPISAGSAMRACSDSLAASPPPSWAGMIVTNFTDSTAYVRASLPAGVQIDGFIANTGTSTYDPRVSTNTVELRFSPNVARTSVLHFAPQDSEANATCLNFYNTSTIAATAQIRLFSPLGFASAVNVNMAAGALVRACSDPIVASPPPSWAGVVDVNFADSTYRAEVSLPQNVKVDGFVVWNPVTGTVDPRTTTSNFLNLRFEEGQRFDQIFMDGFDP